MKWKNVAFVIAVFVSALSASPAMAWNCPTGQHRVQAPAGTPTTAPFYDVVEGIAFICEPDKPNSPPPSPSTQSQQQNQSQSTTNSLQNTTTNKNSSASNSTSNANSNSSSKSASVSSSSSKSAVNNSGNSSATGGNASASNNSSGNTSTYESNSSYNEVRQNPGAYAPTILSTSPCTKGFSGGASTPAVAATLGISTTDKGCDSRQTAVIFHGLGNDFAAAKILCSTSASKRAKLTLEECLAIVVPPAPVVLAPPAPQAQPVPVSLTIVPIPVSAPPVSEPVKSSGSLTEIGECKLVDGKITNVCKRILDDAIVRLNNLPDAKLRVSGPIESTQAVKYLKTRVSPSRVEYIFADEQNATVQFELWSIQ